MVGAGAARGLSRAVALSAGAHIVAFTAAIVVGNFHHGANRPPQSVLVTKLVRLGKERPENYLPRKVEAQQAASAPVPIAVKGAVPKPLETKTGPTAKERLNEISQVGRALERLRAADKEEPEGRADGVRGGEVSDLAHAIEGNRYVTEVSQCLKANYAVEGTAREAVKNRSALVVIFIDAGGNFVEHRIERSSGLPAFDRAVERALKLCGKVSPPPADLRDKVREGLEVEFQP